MGTVYEAQDPLINRKVALKTMVPGLAENAELRQRFLREAQAAGGLRHRNIVTVYDLGEDRGQPYIAMEYIEGTDLERLISSGEQVSIEWKLDVLRQVCEGLGYAHRAGIVHRDIKPANIRVTPDGEVKIMDFGIAHLQSSTMTKSGLVLGTVHYMAPEQIVGQRVDHRADIFSVGAIAYELISRRKPFEGDSITSVMYKIMHDRPDPAVLPRSEYSPGLETVVMKALSRELHDRYQSLDEMHADLTRLVREMAARLEKSDPALPLLQGAREERSEGHVGQALTLAREALRLAPGNAEAQALIAELEKEEVKAKAARLVEEGRRQLAEGEAQKALECANQALALAKGDADAQGLARQAEGAILGQRVNREAAELRAELERARSEGQLQKALTLCRRLLELTPGDAALGRLSSEIEAAIKEREVEQLCGMAISYAADGELDLARKIAGKIERLDPSSPRFLELKNYIEEEGARRAAEALVATARDHLGLGNLAEAKAAAEEALAARPSHAAAREIRDRVASVLQKASSRTTPVPGTAPPESAEPATQALEAIRPAASALATPEPESPPPPPEPDAPAPEAPAPAALAEPAAPVEAPAAPVERGDPRKREVEALTTAALNHFVQNDYPKARKAVEKALALDPQNKRAKELAKILGALG
jgi:serine/threonine-protein kinase